jgi:putative ATP-dependent endonuclease of the OLD family
MPSSDSQEVVINSERDSKDPNQTADFTEDEFIELFVESVRVKNFKGIGNTELLLEPDVTFVVGRNNAGKSRLLRALAIAVSSVRSEPDDITVDSEEETWIEITIAPRNSDSSGTFAPRIAARLNRYIQLVSRAPDTERICFRTTIKRSIEGYGVRVNDDHQAMRFDLSSNSWTDDPIDHLRLVERQVLSGVFVSTKRDLVEDLTQRNSAIRRLLTDLEIDDSVREDLEEKLTKLSGEIVSSSQSLASVQESLVDLTKLVSSLGEPGVRALPGRLEDLWQAVSIDLDTGGGGLPARFHGAGARSLASLQVQRLLYHKLLGKDIGAFTPWPLTMIEEPEVHLHPQAQAELPELFSSIPGQKIISSHSPHLVTIIEPRQVRVLRSGSGGLRIADFAEDRSGSPGTIRVRRPDQHFEEMEKLKRLVERPFGELIFADVIVMGDGATERAFLPQVIKNALGSTAHGVTVVDPGGLSKNEFTIAIHKFTQLNGITWLAFCDGDEQGLISQVQLLDLAKGDQSRVIGIKSHISPFDDMAFEKMLVTFDESLCVDACQTIGFVIGTGSVFDFMKTKKGSMGKVLAFKFLEKYPWVHPSDTNGSVWPACLVKLVHQISVDLTMMRA